MDARELFKQAVAQAGEVVESAREEDFKKPTPNTEWDVRALLDHMFAELAWSADLIEGKTIAEVGDKHSGDLIGTDVAASWESYAQKALAAVKNVGLNSTAHLSFGDYTQEYFLRQISNDLFIHAWDLGEGLGEPVRFTGEIAEELYEYNRASAEELAASGQFASPVTVAEDADTQAKLLALTGRSADWRA